MFTRLVLIRMAITRMGRRITVRAITCGRLATTPRRLIITALHQAQATVQVGGVARGGVATDRQARHPVVARAEAIGRGMVTMVAQAAQAAVAADPR